MKVREKNGRVVVLNTLCAILWCILAIMDGVHGDGWAQIVLHLSLAFCWGIIAYRKFKEESIC